MDDRMFSKPIDMKNIQITDEFWKAETELVRTQVIPYQWDALNDNVPGAAPSYCMHNYKAAAKINKARIKYGQEYATVRELPFPWGAAPKEPGELKDEFYGFVFQDSDFSKWIEAVAYSLIQHPDEELEKQADEAIDIVAEAQLENGYLDTYYILSDISKAFSNLKDCHELYCFGHLIEGAVAYYQATKKDKLLNVAIRFADYVCEKFGLEEGKIKGYPGHEIAEMALVRLYEVTQNKKYLDLAKYFIDERGKRPYYFDIEDSTRVAQGKENEERYAYNQAHMPVRNQDEAVGHAVRAVYLYSGMADMARLTKDEELKNACQTIWNNIVTKKLYVTGGIGATHLGEAFSFNYDLPNDTVYSETCASIGLVFFARRMLQMEPKAQYADVMELALYNVVLAGMAMDGKSFFYVNPLEVNPEACKKDERKFHVKSIRQKWFGCACCPPNIARTLTSVSAYAYTENEDTLFCHLYVGGKVRKEFAQGETFFNVESKIPNSGDIKITCIGDKTVNGTLALRIPGWASSYKIESGFSNDRDFVNKDGYLYISKNWSKGDCISLTFEMEPVIIQANGNVSEDIGKVCIMRGPITYCLEEVDNGNALWQLKLDKNTKLRTTEIKIGNNDIIAIEADGMREIKNDNEGALYSKYKEPELEKKKLTFVPYYTWNNRGEGEMSVWIRI